MCQCHPQHNDKARNKSLLKTRTPSLWPKSRHGFPVGCGFCVFVFLYKEIRSDDERTVYFCGSPDASYTAILLLDWGNTAVQKSVASVDSLQSIGDCMNARKVLTQHRTCLHTKRAVILQSFVYTKEVKPTLTPRWFASGKETRVANQSLKATSAFDAWVPSDSNK